MGDDGQEDSGGLDAAFDSAFLTAHDVYETVSFQNSHALYNRPAPRVTFTLAWGVVMMCVMMIMWALRYQTKKKAVPVHKWTWLMSIRAMISAAIDNDSPVYTMVKISAQSIIFLAGIQIDYHTAFFVMVVFFTVESSLDSLRTLLCVYEYDNHEELQLTSERMQLDLNLDATVTKLNPTNVYEDLSRDGYVVVMVFITQFLLITFVVIDILHSSTHNCPDGTSGCPVGGTLGSWCFYCLGIFMACLVLLGPKTNFGESEQNPVFWMQILLYLKAGKGKLHWTDKKMGVKEIRHHNKSDWRVWTRFLMSFIINGIGFHVLVFALPIQIAAQSSLTGVVFRAVGMLYLVDLDDSPGYTLTFEDKDYDDDDDNDEAKEDKKHPNEATALLQGGSSAVAAEAKAILQEARDKLDALAAGAAKL